MCQRASDVRARGGGAFSLLLAMVALSVLAGCATGAPRTGLLPGWGHSSLTPSFPDDARTGDEDDDPEDDVDEEVRVSGAVADEPESSSSHGQTRRSKAAENAPLEDGGEGEVGWRDGVGDGRPSPVPMSLDYFQGLLAHAGVPEEALPWTGASCLPRRRWGCCRTCCTRR